MTRDVLLINTNIVRPPVSPLGLEYIGEALIGAGVSVRVLDLSFESNWIATLRKEIIYNEPVAIGLPVRNTDDCSFASKRSFLRWICDVVNEIRQLTDTYIVLGGVGFSVMPEIILKMTGANFGIVGDGEDGILALVRCLMKKEGVSGVPNLIYWHDGKIMRNPMAYVDLSLLPVPRRSLFDNRRYEELGAMVGIETKRGCSQRCIFCADPVAKGHRVRLRPPGMVVQEFQNLIANGVSWFHLCDSEFNLPIDHAKEICRAIMDSKLGDKLKWYTYCSPIPFDRELADLMKRAGCRGVNFGVDSLCDEQLRRLGRGHSKTDVQQLIRILREYRLNYMFDFLVGGPGETEDTIAMTIDGIRELDVPLVGIAAGVRVYQGTPLSDTVIGEDKRGLHPNNGSEVNPIFYLSPSLGDDVSGLIEKLTAGDPRFMFLSSPEDQGSYNYVDAEDLCRMIQDGARGAYWDIISQSSRK